jgi:WhiB family redox-sensing transcriptional regulator
VTWRDRALCTQEDPEVFFPLPSDTHGEELAKATCRICPVSSNCLQDALDKGIDFGIWGGLTEEERRASRRAGVAA